MKIIEMIKHDINVIWYSCYLIKLRFEMWWILEKKKSNSMKGNSTKKEEPPLAEIVEDPHEIQERKRLLEKIEEDPYEAENWIELFEDHEKSMSAKVRSQLIQELQETFDDVEMRRLTFGNSIGGIYSDEEAMLDSIPKTMTGLTTLCSYLRRNLTSEYGFTLLFEEFAEVMDVATKDSMKTLLRSHFTSDYLKCVYPYEFGFPDIEDEDMYDWDSLEPQLSPELRDYFMDGMK